MPSKDQASLPFLTPKPSPTAKAPEALSTRPASAPEPDTFHRGDAFQFLKDLPPQSVDLVITDPPYESLELHRGKGTTTRLVGNWFEPVPNARLPELFSLIYRALKPDRHFYLFCDEYTADVIKAQQEITTARDSDGGRKCKSGFRYWREIVWVKTNKEGTKPFGGMGYHYRSSCERVLFFEKGKRKLNDLGIPDVLMCPRADFKAPAGKPLAVNQTLVTQSTQPGELVLDPFCGSGVVGLAAMKTQRQFWLGDLDDSYLLPEVREKAIPRMGKFLLVVPCTKDPELFIAELVDAVENGNGLTDDAAHDRDMFALDAGPGLALVQKLVEVRPLERGALMRRYIRSLPWNQAARTALVNDLKRHPTVETWVAWLDR